MRVHLLLSKTRPRRGAVPLVDKQHTAARFFASATSPGPLPPTGGGITSTTTHDGPLTTAPTTDSVVLDSKLIPRIDLTWGDERIARAISEAAAHSGPGFFYVLNHGIDGGVFEQAIAAGHRFYTGGLEEKKGPSSLNCFGKWGIKGYNAPGSEGAYSKDEVTDVRPAFETATENLNTRESYVTRYPEFAEGEVSSSEEEGGPRADGGAAFRTMAEKSGRIPPIGCVGNRPSYLGPYGEFFSAMTAQESQLRPYFDERAVSKEDVGRAAEQFFAPNPWPDPDAAAQEEFRPALSRYFAESQRVAERFFLLFERITSTEINRDLGMTTFNMARYGKEEKDTGTLGISDHTDWNLFTLLFPSYYSPAVGLCDAQGRKTMQNPSSIKPEDGLVFTGLEAWYQDRWIAVPHIPGALILNQGEMLSRISFNRLKAPVHRVRPNTSTYDRYSLVSFWGPNYDYLLPDRDGTKVLTGEYYLGRNHLL